MRPRIGPYKTVTKLGRVGYELNLEVCNLFVRVYVSRLSKNDSNMVETGDPKDGDFKDSMRILRKKVECENRRNNKTCASKRRLSAQIGGQKLPP